MYLSKFWSPLLNLNEVFIRIRHVLKIFSQFRVFVFRYRATTENTELAENKIGVIFDWKNPWKGIRLSWEIILSLLYQWRNIIIIFRRFRRFREFRGINLAKFHLRFLTQIEWPDCVFAWQVFFVFRKTEAKNNDNSYDVNRH